MNPILQRERNHASFDVAELTSMLYGGEEALERKRYVRRIVEEDPIFDKSDRKWLSRSEQYERSLQKVKRAVEQIVSLGLHNERDLRYFTSAIDENLPNGVHSIMFIPTIRGQGTDEQQAKWLPLALSHRIIGTYAQTELGHGSYIRGCETTATFDPKNDEFVIHTPTLTATKWWPGGLAKTSNYVVCMAQLIIHGKNYGLHAFLVQTRSLETHDPLPGITIGDIGPKYGYQTVDNGFLRFDHVRIPREQMLMRYAKVSRDGVYTKPPHAKISYGTMVYVRTWIILNGSKSLARACTIAIRYSAVRKQFPRSDDPSGSEVSVLDYQTQQNVLFPLLAAAFAMHFTGQYMMSLYEGLQESLKTRDVSALPEVHATSSGLKALVTYITSDGMETCRQACGGHGYMHASGFIQQICDYVPAKTYEGENIIMYLQAARYLVKMLKNARKGEPLVGNVKYLEDLEWMNQPCACQTKADFLEPKQQLHIFRHRAAQLLIRTVEALDQDIKSGIAYHDAWNKNTVDLVRCARAHCYYTMVVNFVNAVNDCDASPSVRRVLKLLCDLFSLHSIELDAGEFMEDGYLTGSQMNLIRAQHRELLAQIRPDAIPLVDAWDFSDHLLGSDLGRYDGNVYQALYDNAQKAPLNRSHRPPGYEKYLKPLFDGSALANLSAKL